MHRRAMHALLVACLTLMVLGMPTFSLALEKPLFQLSVPVKDMFTPQGFTTTVKELWGIIGPGGKLHPAAFLEHKGHLVVEGLLLGVILYLFLQTTFKPHARSEEPLSEHEVDQLCKEWKTEPLVPIVTEQEKVPDRVVTSYDGKYVEVNGIKALDLATFNFLRLEGTTEQEAVAAATIDKYGVGSCGPRGFYGTIDVHLELEDELAKFMGTPEAIVYSFDIATITSIIPAFANRKDVLVIDEWCAYPIKQGAILSRAEVHYFKHNDMQDLERILQRVDAAYAKERRPLNRRLIVVEGIYTNTGELAPLDKLYELKEKYRYRLAVEESFSFGVLGKTGRGAVEHWGLRPDQVEIVCGSMGTALGSMGGFCVGTRDIVEHQRLSGSGYCFSASLPPYLATAAMHSLAQIGSRADRLVPQVQAAAAALRKALQTVPGFTVMGPSAGNDISPVVHLRLSHPPADNRSAEQLMIKVADHLLNEGGVLAYAHVHSSLDKAKPPPSLRFCAHTDLDAADVAKVVAALKRAAKQLL